MLVNGIERSYVVHDEENVKGFFGEYRWMSNFHVAQVCFHGLLFPSTENAYQSAKTDDPRIIEQMMLCTPSESKRISRSLHREGWDNIKLDIMSAIVFEKFYHHRDLRQMLLSTGNKYLEETNHWGDRFWGVCDGKGENNLGKGLMGVRSYWGSLYPDKLGLKIPKVNPLF